MWVSCACSGLARSKRLNDSIPGLSSVSQLCFCVEISHLKWEAWTSKVRIDFRVKGCDCSCETQTGDQAGVLKERKSLGRDTGLVNNVCRFGNYEKRWASLLRLTQKHILSLDFLLVAVGSKGMSQGNDGHNWVGFEGSCQVASYCRRQPRNGCRCAHSCVQEGEKRACAPVCTCRGEEYSIYPCVYACRYVWPHTCVCWGECVSVGMCTCAFAWDMKDEVSEKEAQGLIAPGVTRMLKLGLD